MKAYREEGFPITIVRPSLTYGDTQIVLAVNSWQNRIPRWIECDGARRSSCRETVLRFG